MSLRARKRLTVVCFGVIVIETALLICSFYAIRYYKIKTDNNYEEQVEDEICEAEENELIEEALLSKANKIESCTVTHYCSEKYNHVCGTGDGIDAMGRELVPYVSCAVPDYIPLGSTVIVELYGQKMYLVATDRGGGINGDRIDICVNAHDEALNLGQYVTTVYWIEE